jgi:dihydrofolate synthase/folylpolyglutamate synthase
LTLNYREALAWLEGRYNLEGLLGSAAVEAPTLERMRMLAGLMGDPQHSYPIIHLTGTNGKGSTARMISALVSAHGLDVGGYSSPHIDRVNDRITRANTALSDEDFALAVDLVVVIDALIQEKFSESVNYFEAMCGAAFGWFANNAIDVAVIEVGMGGTWDATNVADADVAVVTNIALDHVEIIGPTLLDIAKEKSGIIKPDSHVVLGPLHDELAAAFTSRPSREIWRAGIDFELVENHVAVGGRMVTVRTPGGLHEGLFVPVHGAHQGENAALAIAVVEAFFGRPIDDEVLSEGLATVTLPARFELLGRHPLVAVDGAHNPAGAATAAATLFDDFGSGEPPILVVGCNRPHDPAKLLEAMRADEAALVVATAPDWSRSVAATDVADAAHSLGIDVEVRARVGDAVDFAIERAGEQGAVLVCGSLYVAGEARGHLGAEGR